MRRHTIIASTAALLSMAVGTPAEALVTSTEVRLETVDDYTYTTFIAAGNCWSGCAAGVSPCCSSSGSVLGLCPSACHSNDITCNELANKFMNGGVSDYGSPHYNGIMSSGVWTFASSTVACGNGHWWCDSHVWASDFYDSGITTDLQDNDTYIDASGTAIALWCSHGTCNDTTTTTCTTDADCGSGYCPGGSTLPSGYRRTCIVETPRSFLTSSNAANSVHEGNLVNYGRYAGGSYLQKNLGAAALGSNLGHFDCPNGHCASGGGANIAMMFNSCGFRSRYFVDTTAFMFAGMHAAMFVVPTMTFERGHYSGIFWYPDESYLSDWAIGSDQGLYLGSYMAANLLAPTFEAWNPTMSLYFVGVPSTGAGAGGWPTGLNVDGAHVTLARDSTASGALYHAQQEVWFDPFNAKDHTNDAYDPTGSAYWNATWTCNYDCNALGW